jgi:hypothetical protein
MKSISAAKPGRTVYERRVGMRTSLTVPVLIETSNGPCSARLCNLSEGGAMVETHVPMKIGEHVVVNCGSIAADGVVAWEEDNFSGIEFDRPLDENEVARQILRSNAVAHRRQAMASAASK